MTTEPSREAIDHELPCATQAGKTLAELAELTAAAIAAEQGAALMLSSMQSRAKFLRRLLAGELAQLERADAIDLERGALILAGRVWYFVEGELRDRLVVEYPRPEGGPRP